MRPAYTMTIASVKKKAGEDTATRLRRIRSVEKFIIRGAESTRVRVRPYGENFENLCIWGKFLKNFFFFRGKKVSLEENIFPLGDIF